MHLQRSGLVEKLFFITRPDLQASGLRKRLSDLGRRIMGIKDISWPDFRAALESVGYVLPSDPPPAGAVIGFDREARAVNLTVGARTSVDYLRPMRQWLDCTRTGPAIPHCPAA
jgi:hypothetical protein